MMKVTKFNFSPGRPVVHIRAKVYCSAAKTSPMSDWKRKARKENVSGAFYVDHTCIDCDTCRWVSPSVFSRAGDKSAVVKQPSTKQEREASMQALLSCPTYSIHVDRPEKGELKAVQESFPIPIAGTEDLFYNGFTDDKSFAASSYFIKRAGGNILVDCPRYNPALIKRFDSMGGIKYIFLTHKDDVGDHAKWAKHYQAKRIFHRLEVRPGTKDCEILLDGEGPWVVDDDVDLNEMEIIHVPGHTDGSICLFHKPSKTMFTGDHFGYSERVHGYTMFPRYNDYSIEVQYQSVLKLANYDFVRVLPGHGRKFEVDSPDTMKELIRDFASQNAS